MKDKRVNINRVEECASGFSKQECKALIEVLELRGKLCDKQQEVIYFRGYYDGAVYLKKTGFYNVLAKEKAVLAQC